MTEVPPPDPTAELLRGADRPRPLPPELRTRLADRLMAANRGQGSDVAGVRPLPSELRGRLADALPSEGAPDTAAAGDAAGSAAEPGPRRAWRWATPAAAVAAALLVVAALVGLSVRGGGSNNPHTTAAASGSNSRRPAAPPASSSGPGVGGAGGARPGAGSGAAADASSAAGQSPSAGGAARSGTSAGAATPGATAAAAPAVPAPSVSRVSPAAGPTTGGTWVTVSGENLGSATQVRFGTTAARQLVLVSGTEVRALSPAHALGTVDVTVVAPGGASAVTPADRYTFLP